MPYIYIKEDGVAKLKYVKFPEYNRLRREALDRRSSRK